MIFVFGSNRAGRHGAGAALYARRYKAAVYGVGEGMTGRAYALPTMNERLHPLTLDQIKAHVDTFLAFAKDKSHLRFQVTCVGCGLGGQHHFAIAPMFVDAPENCFFDIKWKQWLGEEREYWGTF